MKSDSFKKICFITYATLFVLFVTEPISASEQIHDQYSGKRDKVFASFVLFEDGETIYFKRILVPLEPNENRYSIRQGREVLALFRDGILVQQLDEIGGYSSLFLDKKSLHFHDLNGDDYKDLIIQIKEHESLPRIWIYKNRGTFLEFVKTIQCHYFELINNHLKIEYSIYKSWDESYELAGIEDLSPLRRYDFYKMQNSSLINVNSEYREFFSSLLKEYYHRVEILKQRKSIAKTQYLKINLSNHISDIKAIINEYQHIVSAPEK